MTQNSKKVFPSSLCVCRERHIQCSAEDILAPNYCHRTAYNVTHATASDVSVGWLVPSAFENTEQQQY